MPSVFLSYSHKDEAWKDRLKTHLGVLGHHGAALSDIARAKGTIQNTRVKVRAS